MDHVIAPLDPDHAVLVTRLSTRLVDALSLGPAVRPPSPPHVTLVSYTGLAPGPAAAALAPVLATAPVTVRAHGYGVFTGDDDRDLSLHVMVVRSRELDELHARVGEALASAGACLAGITRPGVWSPHVTLLERALSPASLAAAVAALAERPQPRWSLTLGTLVLVGRRGLVEAGPRRLPLTAAHM